MDEQQRGFTETAAFLERNTPGDERRRRFRRRIGDELAQRDPMRADPTTAAMTLLQLISPPPDGGGDDGGITIVPAGGPFDPIDDVIYADRFANSMIDTHWNRWRGVWTEHDGSVWPDDDQANPPGVAMAFHPRSWTDVLVQSELGSPLVGSPGVFARATHSGGEMSGYVAYTIGLMAFIARIDAGVLTGLAAGMGMFSAGHTLGLHASGSTLTVYKGGGAIPISATDATYASGYAGLCFIATGASRNAADFTVESV